MPLQDPVYLAKRLLFLFPGLWSLIHRIPEWRYFSQIATWRLRQQLKDVRISLVFVHRLYMLSYAAASPGAKTILDLDDWESVTRRRLGELAKSAGMDREQRKFDQQARCYEELEAQSLPGQDRILVCSESDAAGIRSKHGCRPVTVLPNVVTVGDVSGRSGKFERGRLLFVGSFGYLPNWDAAVYATRCLLPHLPECRLSLIGRESSRLPRDVLEHPRVDVHDDVDDLGAHYRKAALALVTVRAGGGTRIKILEAMAHGCPVVSTKVGAEGLAATPGEELMVGVSDQEMVGHCRALIENTSLGEQLSRKAHAWILRYHSRERWTPIFDGFMGEVEIE